MLKTDEGVRPTVPQSGARAKHDNAKPWREWGGETHMGYIVGRS